MSKDLKNNEKQEMLLEIDELISHLEKKNVKFNDKEKAKETLSNLGYFKLKEFSYIYRDENGRYFDNTYFENFVDNFYLDKKLRLEILSLIENIEIYLKTKLVQILGKKGAYTYLDLPKWVNREADPESIKRIHQKILKKNDKIVNMEYFDKKVVSLYVEKYKKKVLPIWVIMETLTLGEVKEMLNVAYPKMFENMYINIYLEYDEFLSNLEIIKDVRNMSAHNNDVLTETYSVGNIIDVIEIILHFCKSIDIDVDYNGIKKILLEIEEKTYWFKNISREYIEKLIDRSK
ncbi:Abi family protein [Streptobacillus notomytis]|uniref:Abi family protein n=1 Tax=Streptobacillus notomytis TaxID=1712031 RepID=UPI000833D1D7|nr:Abi family protein [Streptobacillus notomytis]